MKIIYYNYSDYPSIEKQDVACAKIDMEDAIENIHPELKVKVSGKGYDFGDGEIRIKGIKKHGVNIEDLVKALKEKIPWWSFEI